MIQCLPGADVVVRRAFRPQVGVEDLVPGRCASAMVEETMTYRRMPARSAEAARSTAAALSTVSLRSTVLPPRE
jgi:hypothetical protein